jgi:hypothetical protein
MPPTFGMMDLEWFVIYLLRMYGQEHDEEIRRDTQDLMLPRLVSECFHIGEVETKAPTVAQGLKRSKDAT